MGYVTTKMHRNKEKFDQQKRQSDHKLYNLEQCSTNKKCCQRTKGLNLKYVEKNKNEMCIQ